MEDIISLLVAIGVIFSGLSKLMEKFTKQETGQGQYEIPVWEENDSFSELTTPTYEDTDVQETKADLAGRELNLYMEEKESLKKKQSKKTDSRGKVNQVKEESLFSGGITEEDLIKGIIFQEILGEPRCRR